MNIEEKVRLARLAQNKCLNFTEKNRTDALLAIAKKIREQKAEILTANQKDMEAGKSSQLSAAILDRLLLTEARIEALAQTAEAIAAQEPVIGKRVLYKTRPDGLEVYKQRVPIGVLCMIFESRPNVVIDCSCLAIKSGNAILLKGGKEAKHSNHILTEIVRSSVANFIDKELVQEVEDRNEIAELLKRKDWIDLVIPRGGESLIQYVYENAKMPVIAHFQGICHLYIHEDASPEMAKAIVLNAKMQRPGVCNAMETLLIHKNFPAKKEILEALKEAGCELRLCKDLQALQPGSILATEEDWQTEYLDKILSCKECANLEEAIQHIQTYGSKHTEAILCESQEIAQKFLNSVDASCLVHNASTRFNDGGELGLGAELGISTTKIHAYGPMGAQEMTIERFLLLGKGQVRS